jgi:hypothetical protein
MAEDAPSAQVTAKQSNKLLDNRKHQLSGVRGGEMRGL